MSIQDDILDVHAALDTKPEAVTFQRIIEHYLAQEEEHDAIVLLVKSIQVGHKAANVLYGDKDR